MFEQITKKNPNLKIILATRDNFSSYGEFLDDSIFQPLIECLRTKEIPEEGNCYIADDSSMSFPNAVESISRKYYSEMPIQIGYCNGHTHTLNAFEYHQGDEINFMATDCILMLAHQCDIVDGNIDSSKAELFYFPAGTVIELYGTSLHFAPCAVTKTGFQVGVILPLGTNKPLEHAPSRPLIWGKNKWLIAHPDSPVAKRGAYVGITGKNTTVSI
ncbi:MAG: DUF4867 family protein [Clostridia bacterium]|nr:DUF4867 family protein [Clostridia bacterium]